MDACRSLLSLYESIDEKVDKFASLKVILLGHLCPTWQRYYCMCQCQACHAMVHCVGCPFDC